MKVIIQQKFWEAVAASNGLTCTLVFLTVALRGHINAIELLLLTGIVILKSLSVEVLLYVKIPALRLLPL